MRKNITKLVTCELKSILDSKGYWSPELRNFIDSFENQITKTRLHNKAKAYTKNYITLKTKKELNK